MLRKKSKIISIVLVILLSLTMLGGCKNAADTSEQEEQKSDIENGQEDINEDEEEEITYDFGGRSIRYVAWWNRGPKEDGSEREEKQLARIAEMEDKYNAKLEFIEVPFGEYQENLVASSMAGTPIAEISFIFSHWYYPGFVTSGMLYPASELKAFDFTEDKWIKTINQLTTFKGKQYGFRDGRQEPRAGMWWNKTIFDRDGLPNLYELQDSKEWTWDKMLEIAQKATKDTDGDGIIDQWGLNGFSIEWTLVFSNEAEVITVNDDGSATFALTNPKAIEALQFYQDIINVHKVFETNPSGASWDYPMLSFQGGKVAMHASEWWVGDSYLTDGMEDDYGFVFFPMGPQATEYVSQGGEECFEVIPAAVTNPEEVAIIWNRYTDPFLDDDPDAWKQVYETAADDSESIRTVEVMQDKGLVKTNLLQGFHDLNNIMWNSLLWHIFSGAKTPQTAVDEVAQQAQSILNDALKIE